MTKQSTQNQFAVDMTNRYLSQKRVNAVGVRRLHYFIVSLPESERMIPGRKTGEYSLYSNTKEDYSNLSRLLVNVRIKGLVPFSSIIDEKNVPPVFMPEREQAESGISYSLPSLGSLPKTYNIEKMPEWDYFTQLIRLQCNVHRPRFINQDHRLVVAIEKATSQEKLTAMCQKYGADLLIFSGQFSVTRVHDIIQKAQEEELPLCVLYISDLDCAGWTMGPAFMDRLNAIYPNSDHEFVRVALTRHQAIANNLPKAFDPDSKGYKPGHIARFIEESGGEDCIELDALDEDVLLTILERELERRAGLKEDEDCYHAEWHSITTKRDMIMLEMDAFRDRYNILQTKFNTLVKEFSDLYTKSQDVSNTLEREKYQLIDDIQAHIEDKITDYADLWVEEEVSE